MTPTLFSKTAVLEQFDIKLSGLNSLINDCMSEYARLCASDMIPPEINSRKICDNVRVIKECEAAVNSIRLLKQDIEDMPTESYRQVTCEAMQDALIGELLQFKDSLRDEKNKLWVEAASALLTNIDFSKEEE